MRRNTALGGAYCVLLTAYVLVRCMNKALQLAARSYIHEISNESRTNFYPARTKTANMQALSPKSTSSPSIPAKVQAFPPFSFESSQSGANSCIIAGIYHFRREKR